jgi:NADH-quinone oxidoreductase subunit G
VINNDWNGFNILHNHASMVGGLDIGFYTDKNLDDVLNNTQDSIIYLLGEDEIDIAKLKGHFVIYQGHNGNELANIADVILPSAGYTEQDAIYVNMEGRVQEARRAVQAPFEAQEDWYIISLLSKALDYKLCESTLSKVRNALFNSHKVLKDHNIIINNPCNKIITDTQDISSHPITKVLLNYYMTDVISKASVTMARCTKNLLKSKEVNSEKS